MKITTKGQVTIPREIRERLGLMPHTEVDFEIRDGDVVLTKAMSTLLTRDASGYRDYFPRLRVVAPSRR